MGSLFQYLSSDHCFFLGGKSKDKEGEAPGSQKDCFQTECP